MTTIFTKPDRSNHIPRFTKSDDSPAVDIGWNEGFLSDGRAYRVEAWAEDGITCVTFFMPTAGIENFSNNDFVALLEREHLVSWRDPARKSAYAMPCSDAAGNSMWSVNVVIGTEDGVVADDRISLRPYDRGRLPDQWKAQASI